MCSMETSEPKYCYYLVHFLYSSEIIKFFKSDTDFGDRYTIGIYWLKKTDEVSIDTLVAFDAINPTPMPFADFFPSATN